MVYEIKKGDYKPKTTAYLRSFYLMVHFFLKSFLNLIHG